MTIDVDALAYRFWSIHPTELDEWAKAAPSMPKNYKGGMCTWFFACSMRDALNTSEPVAWRGRHKIHRNTNRPWALHDVRPEDHAEYDTEPLYVKVC